MLKLVTPKAHFTPFTRLCFTQLNDACHRAFVVVREMLYNVDIRNDYFTRYVLRDWSNTSITCLTVFGSN